MISVENEHKKHTKLARPFLGQFGRRELSVLGAGCNEVKQLAYEIISQLPAYKIAFVDAEHDSSISAEFVPSLTMVNKMRSIDFSYRNKLNEHQQRAFINDQDLVLINGNHFPGEKQIIIVNAEKSLENKIDKLTDVQGIINKTPDEPVPGYLKNLKGFQNIPVLAYNDKKRIVDMIEDLINADTPSLNGLVLAGGKSIRMKTDKANLNYYGLPQQKHLLNLLSGRTKHSFISVNNISDSNEPNDIIRDTFLNLGPLSGILSALQKYPDCAWLTIACDLPFLSEKTIDYLISHRNPSKVATAFNNPASGGPEPLITIWEPKSYLIMLQFLAQGYSCPRKILMNSDIELLEAPDYTELKNVNTPEEYEEAVFRLNNKSVV